MTIKESNHISLKEAGRKGGSARAEKYSKEQLSEQAKRGAQTVERTRPGFHSEIGRKGGKSSGGAGNKNIPSAPEHDDSEEVEY
jgi:general stress protein YciG